MKNLSEKHKFYVILAGLFLVLLVCHGIAFKNTFRLARKYREQKEKALEAKDLPQQTALLKNRLTELNSVYFDEIDDNDDTHEVVLERFSKLASDYKVSVTEFPSKHICNLSSVQIETHESVLRGKFINLLKVLHQLEVNEKVGRIVSVQYFTEINRKSKRKYLYSRVYIQNYRNSKAYENY